jgi:7-cyano-7-deazaguanine synthase
MTAKSKSAIVLLSGGLDSMVVAGLAREAGYDLIALTIDYNQRHRIELDSAATIAAHLGAIEHIVLPLDLTRFGGSALTADIAVPKEGVEENAIPVTYVPARNTIFLSLCLGLAEARGARDLWIGVNALDYSGYPDCRPDFIRAFEGMANLATKVGVESHQESTRFRVHAPIIQMSKAQIIQTGMSLGVDFSQTVSCYQASPEGLACGQCESCRLRKEGFKASGVSDPTHYL